MTTINLDKTTAENTKLMELQAAARREAAVIGRVLEAADKWLVSVVTGYMDLTDGNGNDLDEAACRDRAVSVLRSALAYSALADDIGNLLDRPGRSESLKATLGEALEKEKAALLDTLTAEYGEDASDSEFVDLDRLE